MSLFPYNNLLPQKYMATPYSYRPNSSMVSLDALYVSMFRSEVARRNQNVPSSHLHPQFSLPFSFSYNNWFLQPPPSNFNSSLSKAFFESLQSRPSLKPEQYRQTSGYTNQQYGKEKRKAIVIQISDDEDAVDKKPPIDVKVAPTCKKIDSLPVTIPPKIIQSVTNKQDEQIKIPIKQKIEVKQKEVRNIPKTHKIYKEDKVIKKDIARDNSQSTENTVIKRVILSERINKKIKAMKEPYHITKREKEMLKITRLRDYANEILTGPKFQANLPEFIIHNSDLQKQKSKIKKHLLARLYKDEQ